MEVLVGPPTTLFAKEFTFGLNSNQRLGKSLLE